MSSEQRSRLLRYGLTSVLGLAVTYFYVSSRLDLTDLKNVELVDLYRTLCDGFTVPGMLLLMFACLLSISGTGALDGVAYVTSYAIKMLIPGRKDRMERYYDYVERKRAKRVKGFGFLYIVGGAFMAIALIFMALFYSIYS